MIKRIRVVLSLALISTLCITLLSQTKPVHKGNVFSPAKEVMYVTDSQKNALLRATDDEDEEIRKNILENWDSISDGDKALYGYLIIKDRYNIPNAQHIDYHIVPKDEYIKSIIAGDKDKVNEAISEVFNSIKAIECIFQKFDFIETSYISQEKLRAIDFYMSELDRNYRLLKNMQWESRQQDIMDGFDKARLHEMNVVRPAMDDFLENHKSRHTREKAYNLLCQQEVIWETALYGGSIEDDE